MPSAASAKLVVEFRCMIGDEMGLGKTIQAISVAYVFKREWPLLIVVPSSLKYPWIEELEKSIGTSKVTILGYGLLTTDARPLLEALNKQRFGVILVDESHYLKSRNAARSKILVPIIQNAKRAILLTGTPALGRPEELFMQIDALYPRRFGTWSDYAKKYCNAHYKFFGARRQWDCRGASNLDELHQRLSVIMIRRLKNQVLTQLPPKIRQRIPFDLPKDAAKEASASFEQWEKLMSSESENQFVEVMSLITHMYKQTAVAKVKQACKILKINNNNNNNNSKNHNPNHLKTTMTPLLNNPSCKPKPLYRIHLRSVIYRIRVKEKSASPHFSLSSFSECHQNNGHLQRGFPPLTMRDSAGAVKDYIKMMLETEQLKFLVFAHHLSMLQACTEAVIEAKRHAENTLHPKERGWLPTRCLHRCLTVLMRACFVNFLCFLAPSPLSFPSLSHFLVWLLSGQTFDLRHCEDFHRLFLFYLSCRGLAPAGVIARKRGGTRAPTFSHLSRSSHPEREMGRKVRQEAKINTGAIFAFIKKLLHIHNRMKMLKTKIYVELFFFCILFQASYIRIDGSVPSAERIQLVHRFQNDPDTRVAILSIQAAGQGLTFTAASHVVFAELYWNPGHIKQAEDRAHRIGQTTTVHIHYLIAKGTFDTVMWAMLNRKETVTGSALNGKKEYLKAEVGDQEKWDFLNFAQAWTPSDTIKGDSEDDKDGMFFSHFERDKQHDIRSFFSPSVNKEKKRKRTGDSPSDGSPLPQLPEGAELVQTAEIRSSDSKPDQGEDFSPQVKRFRQVSPLSRRGGKKSPLSSLCAPRRLSAGLQAPRHNQKWSCSACTFSNSGLLLRCEMCENPRNVQKGEIYTHTNSCLYYFTWLCV
ncbi:DNA annealing helicase and endonuclease ZRANB3 [Labeo rohita]|uniref:DNA annealing helicase and endonuclease ZRANB3 n=1 Tax=Labeo rohita TaxID=84645 RepID=A0ABQ8LKY2_LABRO|nr:DNA annealing helicase and endonuclease ZRANB3 [Labeo rohita]